MVLVVKNVPCRLFRIIKFWRIYNYIVMGVFAKNNFFGRGKIEKLNSKMDNEFV